MTIQKKDGSNFIKISERTLPIADLFKLKSHQPILLPTGGIVIFLSMIIASNFVEHLEEASKVGTYYLGIPFLIILPLLMLLVSMIRNRFKKAKDKKVYSESNTE